MYNADTDLLFPPRAIPALLEVRGPIWRDLVSAAIDKGPDSPEQMALILMLARMNNCATCNADSYRAMNGCTACAKQALKHFRGTDRELQKSFASALADIRQYLENQFQE